MSHRYATFSQPILPPSGPIICFDSLLSLWCYVNLLLTYLTTMMMIIIALILLPVLAMSGRSADRAVTRSSMVGSSIGQQLDSSDWARLCTDDTTPVSLANRMTDSRILVTNALSRDRPSGRRLSVSTPWHLAAVNYNDKHSTLQMICNAHTVRRLAKSQAQAVTGGTS